MDLQRHDEDHHERWDPWPKITLAGRLDGTLDGQALAITADGCDVVVRFDRIGQVWRWRHVLGRLAPQLKRLRGVRVIARIGRLPAINLAPSPNVLTRWLTRF